jgi:hypothetical protein
LRGTKEEELIVRISTGSLSSVRTKSNWPTELIEIEDPVTTKKKVVIGAGAIGKGFHCEILSITDLGK